VSIIVQSNGAKPTTPALPPGSRPALMFLPDGRTISATSSLYFGPKLSTSTGEALMTKMSECPLLRESKAICFRSGAFFAHSGKDNDPTGRETEDRT
jgi:hypothetical protein